MVFMIFFVMVVKCEINGCYFCGFGCFDVVGVIF